MDGVPFRVALALGSFVYHFIIFIIFALRQCSVDAFPI